MKLPTPEQVRICDPRLSPRDNRSIDWDIVDPFLRACKHQGSVQLLAHALSINRVSLSRRRTELRLPPLPFGRNPTVVLTEREKTLVELLAAGHRHSTIARMQGVAQGSIACMAKRIQHKLDAALASGCGECGGFGVEMCDSCVGIGIHHHVCPACGGQSTIWASQGM